jgi:hypothetical protein
MEEVDEMPLSGRNVWEPWTKNYALRLMDAVLLGWLRTRKHSDIGRTTAVRFKSHRVVQYKSVVLAFTRDDCCPTVLR